MSRERRLKLEKVQDLGKLERRKKRGLGRRLSRRRSTSQSIIAQAATLEGIAKTERVFLVDWKALTAQQQDAVLEKLSKRSGAAKDVILKDILKIGLPLLEKIH